ncbi:MAG: DUF6035 family protein [Rhizobiaceae bacterium]
MEEQDEHSSLRVFGNVTVDPLSVAEPAHDLEIEEILDCETGEYLDVRTWISRWRYEQIVEQRSAIRDRLVESPRFRCAICGVPVYLASNQRKRFYFKHQIEDGSCPAQTRNLLSREDILARKYHGLRESRPHRDIKALIARSLAADPRYTDVQQERQWRSSHDPSARRQPDVQATGPMGRLAFEVQLSTTFLDVVVARRTFYREEGGLLIWVMGNFDPDYRRLTTDDLLFTNNSNILTVDEKTAALSEGTGQFHVHCHFRRPVRAGDQLADEWDSALIPFDKLTYERDRQRCWHFDYEGEAAKLRALIEGERTAREAAAADALRCALFAFWIAREPNTRPDAETLRKWSDLRQALAHRNIDFPHLPDSDKGLVALLNGIVSAREAHPVGWHFKQLVEVGHRIMDGYPNHAAAFCLSIEYFKARELVREQDRSGKWEARVQAIRESLRRGDPDFVPDRATLALVGFLMPGTQEKLEKLARKEPA